MDSSCCCATFLNVLSNRLDGAAGLLSPVLAQPAIAPPAFMTFAPLVMMGAGRTLFLAAIAIPIALWGGWGLAALRRSGVRPGPGVVRLAAMAATLVVEGIRRVPLLLLMGAAFALLGGVSPGVAPFTLAALLLGLHHAALLSAGPWPGGIAEQESEVVSTDPEFIPDTAKPFQGRLAESFLALLRDSALASILTVNELTRASTIATRETGAAVIAFGVAASLYILISIPLAWLGNWIERGYPVRDVSRE